MRTPILVLLTTCVCLAALSCARAQRSDARLTREASGRMVTEVRLNGEGPFRFVVDTGAGMSCISKPLAAKLTLPALPLVSVKVQGTAGEQKAAMYMARKYESGLFQRSLESLVELPNASIVSEGVIGMNAFKSKMILFDFASSTVSSLDSGSALDGAESLAAELKGTDVVVPIEIDGVKARAVLDTGARRTIGNPALLQALHLERDKLLPSEPAEGATTDQLPAGLAKCKWLRLGAGRFENPSIVFSDLMFFQRRGLAETPALLLGIDLLSQLHLLAIDYPRAEVKLRR